VYSNSRLLCEAVTVCRLGRFQRTRPSGCQSDCGRPDSV